MNFFVLLKFRVFVVSFLRKISCTKSKQKKRFPDALGAALLEIYRRIKSVVMITLTFYGIQNRFDDTIRHAQAEYRQGIPEPPMKYQVTGIPNPFKIKREHLFPPCNFLSSLIF
jgi:hypothetical protein